MYNLIENNFNELPMQNKWKLALSLVSESETNISSCDVIGNYLWCNLPVWCSCRTCINYSIRQGCATCGPWAKCNTTKWIFMPVTSTRQPVWNEGAARGLICLILFGRSVIKVAHPWYDVKQTVSLTLVICIPTITERLVGAVQPHHLFIYLFVSRHEVHSMNTHTLQNAGR